MSLTTVSHSWFLRGNHSYLKFKVPVRVDGFHSDDGIELILEKLVEFEKRHLDLKIINWKPETHAVPLDGFTADVIPHCYGLWIDYEPREREEADKDPLNRGPVFGELDHALGQD